MSRESLPDPLLTTDGRFVATRSEIDLAAEEVIFGSSAGGVYSMVWGLPGWDVVPTERVSRLSYEARTLCEQIDLTGWEVSEGTRAMLERIGALSPGPTGPPPFPR